MAKSSKVVCKKDQYHIEINGIGHEVGKDNPQNIIFKDNLDAEYITSLDDKISKSKDEVYNSTTYHWDWEEQSEKRNAWLEIKSDNGENIELFLFDNVSAYDLHKQHQDYRLQAIVPMTIMPRSVDNSLNIKYKNENCVVPLREGYLYISYKGKIWREIEVSSTENGEPRFKDINLDLYRLGENLSFDDECNVREATGTELKYILVPQSDNKKNALVHLAYSEVQWSGARLNYMESEKTGDEEFDKYNRVKIPNITSRMEQLSFSSVSSALEQPEMRSREQHFELMLANPLEYSRDLKGSIISKVLKKSRKEINEYHKLGDWTKDESLKYEYNARVCAIEEKIYSVEYYNKLKNREKITDINVKEELPEAFKQCNSFDEKSKSWDSFYQNYTDGFKSIEKFYTESKSAEDEYSEKITKMWSSSETSDYLKNAKSKKINIYVIEDKIFSLRHKNSVLINAQQYLEHLQTDASQEPHFKSAQLLQIFLFSPKLGGKSNPYRKFQSNMDYSENSLYQKVMRTSMRNKVRSDIATLQRELINDLNDKDLSYALRDITSLNDNNLQGAYALINNCRNAIQLSPNEQDKFLPNYFEDNHLGLVETLNLNFVRGSKHPIYVTLFGRDDGFTKEKCFQYLVNQENIEQYLELSDGQKINDGSGIMSPAHLASMSRTSLSINPADLQQVEASAFVESNMKNAGPSKDDYNAQYRRLVTSLHEMFGSYFVGAMKLRQSKVLSNITMFNIDSLVLETAAVAKLSAGKVLKNLAVVVQQDFPQEFNDHIATDIFKRFDISIFGFKDIKNNTNYGTSVPGKVLSENSSGRTEIPHTLYELEEIYQGAKVNTIGTATEEAFDSANNSSRSSYGPTVLLGINNKASKAEIDIFEEVMQQNKNAINEASDMSKLSKSSVYAYAGLPVLFLGFEVWNILATVSSFRKELDNDHKYYAISTIFSALGDAWVATAQVYRTLTQTSSPILYNLDNMAKNAITKLIYNSIINEESRLAKLFLTQSESGSAVKLVGGVTRLAAAAGVFGMLTGALTIYQGIRQFQQGDRNAGLAKVATGALIFITSALPLLFDLSAIPFIGWIIFGAITAFYVASWYLSISPMEKLITNSVFGKDYDENGDYAFLNSQPQEMYKQILNQLIYVDINTYSISDEIKNSGENSKVDKSTLLDLKEKGYSHFSKLDTNAKNILASGMEYFYINCKARKEKIRYTYGDHNSIDVVESAEVSMDKFIDLDNSRLYLYKENSEKFGFKILSKSTVTYQWKIKALAQISISGLLFPQPSIDDFSETKRAISEGRIVKTMADFNDGEHRGLYENTIGYLWGDIAHPKNPYWIYES